MCHDSELSSKNFYLDTITIINLSTEGFWPPRLRPTTQLPEILFTATILNFAMIPSIQHCLFTRDTILC